MNEAPDTDQEPTGYIRLPWQLVGGGLLLFIVGLFAFGMFANRNLRPQAVTAPTASLGESSTPTPVAVTAPTRVGTPTTLPTVVATQTSAAVTQPSATAMAPPVATPRPTVSPELAAEVSSAYQQYWQIRAEALYELDDSRLDQVMAGDHLAAVEDRISELRAEGRAIETEVDHKYVVVQASSVSAEVVDTYVDRSFYVDAQTHLPVSSPTSQTLSELYSLTKTGGTWRVVDLVRST